VGHSSKFQRVSRIASLLQRRRSPEANQTAQCLAVSWAGTLYIHFWRLLSPDSILLIAKFTLRPSLVFSYIGIVSARHSSSGRQPNFVALYREQNYRTFAEIATYIWQGGHRTGIGPRSSHALFWMVLCVGARAVGIGRIHFLGEMYNATKPVFSFFPIFLCCGIFRFIASCLVSACEVSFLWYCAKWLVGMNISETTHCCVMWDVKTELTLMNRCIVSCFV